MRAQLVLRARQLPHLFLETVLMGVPEPVELDQVACYVGRHAKTSLAALRPALTQISPGVQRMSPTAASTVSSAEASRLLDEKAILNVETQHVERTAERLGREVAEDERGGVPTVYLLW